MDRARLNLKFALHELGQKPEGFYSLTALALAVDLLDQLDTGDMKRANQSARALEEAVRQIREQIEARKGEAAA